MTGSSITVIVPEPRLNMLRLELGMTQLPLMQVVCVTGHSWPQPGQGELPSSWPRPRNGLVVTVEDPVMNHGPVSQLTDIQRSHHGGDYGCAVRGDQVIDGSVTWPDTEVLVDS